MALRIVPEGRTQGDGMEKPDNDKSVEHTVVLEPREHSSYVECIQKSGQKLVSDVKLQNSPSAVKLIPHAVKKKKKDLLANLKNKEPKFVPYEPYKAAIKPIVPCEQKYLRQLKKKNSKEAAPIYKSEKEQFGNTEKEVTLEDENKKGESACDWKNKLSALEQELHILKEENEQLENQLKFQVQVNGELKNLLVAAIGEDMETKVHVLTEDKLHLAQALLKSAKSLSSHQEQTEWLAGQCEVWRSKFLASSVMVEELARWKAGLTQKVNEAQDVLKKLLEERKCVRNNLLNTYHNLCLLRNNFDFRCKKNILPSSNIVDLSEENKKLSESLVIQLLALDKKELNIPDGLKNLVGDTPAEKSAEHIITNPHLIQLFGEPDAACNAVVGAAIALSGQLYLQNHPPTIECCPQCSGEIKLV